MLRPGPSNPASHPRSSDAEPVIGGQGSGANGARGHCAHPRQTEPGAPAYSPGQAGGRRSFQAAMPSRRSADITALRQAWSSTSRPASRARS